MGLPLVYTPGASNANSYGSAVRADQLISRERLHVVSAWTNGGSPNAEGYLSDGGASAGAATINVDTGTGSMAVGNAFKFDGHDQEYTVATAFSGAGALEFTPALVEDVADDEAVQRLTPNTREKAVQWSAKVLDMAFDFDGEKTYQTQSRSHPRAGMVDDEGYVVDEDTIHPRIELAWAELAHYLSGRDLTKLPSSLGLGVDRVKVDVIDVSISRSQIIDLIPDYIITIAAPFGRLRDTAVYSGDRVFPLRRV